MTPRQREIETLTFSAPDKVPFAPGGPRESTLARWRREGLPPDVNWWDFLCETIGVEQDRPTAPRVDLGVDFRMIPQFEEEVLEHVNGHYICRDWKGNVCEISDQFDVTYLRHAKDFVTRRWISCPVAGRDDWEQMKLRYAVDAPGRFPADFAERCSKIGDAPLLRARASVDDEACGRRNRGASPIFERDWMLSVGFSGPFWQMREWCGFEGLCMMMLDEPDLVDEMAAFWTEFVAAVLGRILARVAPDRVFISEDMAYKVKAMISPAMTRRFCMPSWTAWSAQLRAAGVPIVDMDSDGYVGELIPLWIESGITVCDPLEVAAGNDIVAMRGQFGDSIAFRQGIDKRAIAKGGAVLRDELKRIEPVLADGGYIPGCDHGVPSDISWANFVAYARRLAEMTGWL